MVLSPGSAIYNHESFRQQHEYHSGLNCNNFFCQTTTQDQDQTNKQPTSKDKIPCLNTWIDNYHHALEQHHINIKDNSSSNRSSMVGWGGELKCLSLSMSPGSQSSCVTASTHISPADHCEAIETKKRGSQKLGQNKQTVHRKSIDTFGQRTSQYRGVTRHRWTGRYEAHLWDNSCKKEGQTRKGRQDISGGYDREEKAARAYDLAALKYWGHCTHINFALENYHQELEEMKNMSRQEYVAHLRRKSSGFSRGASIYRGVTRHHQHGRWQARIGRVAGNKDLYLGTFSTQEEAAEAYDIAAIKFRGANAVTNFDILRYDIEKIMTSNTLPTGDLARRNKEEKPNYVENKVASACDWQMVQYNRSNGQVHENITVENYQNPAFSVALQDLIGIDTSQTTTMTTSPSSSRETLPGNKYAAAPVFFEKPNNILASKFINPASNIIVSWIPTAQLRPVPLTTAHFPSFKAWNDT
ncbi:ap2-like ethylene-responsive transcription factor ant [Phtheirospermum japonicum]|uniref:Ap2-like ethylene-responsive transcription factor ant n=1 Tax=Phtheirospermum japonicum TaxID=374723 RepID=A0A830BJ37_9LAMI|nr:ap2-like ethylene-responsive transcription factor ant [Phtheirospermum japonicum]